MIEKIKRNIPEFKVKQSEKVTNLINFSKKVLNLPEKKPEKDLINSILEKALKKRDILIERNSKEKEILF